MNEDDQFSRIVDVLKADNEEELIKIGIENGNMVNLFPENQRKEILESYHLTDEDFTINLLCIYYNSIKCIEYIMKYSVFSNRLINAAIHSKKFEIVKKILENQDIEKPEDPSILINSYTMPKEILNLLLSKKKIAINSKTSEGLVPLIESIRIDDIEITKMLLENGANPFFPEENPSIFEAAKTNKINFLELLLNYIQTDQIKRTTELAFKFINNFPIFEKFIKSSKVDINYSNPVTLLQHAIYANIADAINLLLDNESLDPNAVDSSHKTAIYYAILKDNIEAIKKLLLNPKTDCNFSYMNEPTPLTFAIRKGSSNALAVLIQCPRITINQQQAFSFITKGFAFGVAVSLKRRINFGSYPQNIFNALKTGNVEILRLLLSSRQFTGNEIDQNHGCTPLHLVCHEVKFPIIGTRLLILYPSINVNSRDFNGNTPLHMAVAAGNYCAVHALLETETIDVNALNNAKNSPLDIAVKKGNIEILNMLLSSGHCDVNRVQPINMTALMQAAFEGKFDVVKALVETGNADISIKTEFGTAIDCAARRNNIDIAKYLFEKCKKT